MKAIIVRDWDPKTFTLEEVETPRPGEGELLIAVHTAPISFGDTLIATGQYQVRPVMPFTPGSECSGVVEAVGPGVAGFRVGDRVLAMGFIGESRVNRRILGSLAEKVLAPIENVTHAPAGWSLRDASLLRSNYETSYYGLQAGRLKPGETLLVLGGGGGTGTAAVAIGKALGAFVIASASTEERRAVALAVGADKAIDTNAPDWREQVAEITGQRGVDVVYDPVGGDASERALRCLAWSGRFVIIGFASGTIPKIALNLPLMKGVSIIGANLLRLIETEPETVAANRGALVALIEAGKLPLPPVAREYGLAQVPDAIAAVQAFAAAGRVVVSVNPALDQPDRRTAG